MIGKQKPYVMVYQDEIIALGADAAVLLAELRFLSRKFQKDEDGYFEVFGTYLCSQLNIGKMKLIRLRTKLTEAGLIDYIQGSNQNAKSRYKIML